VRHESTRVGGGTRDGPFGSGRGEKTVTTRQNSSGRLHFPFENPLESLPATAQKILRAATSLLAERGYEAVTLENVAAAAGVNKASIRYNFGNKAGLIIAVADALIHDECLRLAADVESVPEEERLHAAMVGIRKMILDADSFRGFFDILPHAFRDPELRARLFALYAWWYHQNLTWLGLAVPGAHDNDVLMGLAELIAAIPDGLSVQAGLNPDGFDLSRPLATLEFLLRNSMAQLLEIAASAAAGEAAVTT
jgi:AcrR family transcriptional regulator